MTTGIQLKLLGEFSLVAAGGDVISLPSRKAQALLAYLALNPDQHHARSKLATLLWSRHDDVRARNNLSQGLHQLRRALAPHAGKIVEADRNGVSLKADALAVDVLILRRLANDISAVPPSQAVSLCVEDLLDGFDIWEEAFGDWLAREREAISGLANHVLARLAEAQLDVGEAEGAIATAERLVTKDPLNEAAHRLLMQANAAIGRRNAALQQYRRCAELLRRELGVEPDAETKALRDEVKGGGYESASLEAHPNNLPASVSSFIGRRAEIAEIVELLRSTRLLTLVGAGGSGKTRLSLEVATEVLGEFRDGTWFVELAGLNDSELVPRQIAWSLGLTEKMGRKWSEVLGAFFRDRELLLVLDNCEHLIRSVAALTMGLLHSSPNLRVLATSREVLNVPGEVAWQTPLLSYPNDDENLKFDDLMKYEAVQLFVERARAVRTAVAFQDEDARTVAQICRRLDGLPLAVELAAARLRALSVQQIARHLDDRFSLLTGGDRAAPPRLQTVRETVSWSYELLSPEEQQVFERVSVFAGGFGIEAAREVAGEGAFEGIASLVDKSLLIAQPHGDNMRYRILETFREFGLERLGARISDAKNAHLEWAKKLTNEAAKHFEGPRQKEWFDIVETELQNFRVAMQWAIDSEQPASGLEIAAALYRFWWLRGIREGARWLDLFLALPMELADDLAANALYVAGTLSQALGRYGEAARRLERSLELFNELGDRRRAAWSLHYKMRAQWGKIEPEKSREMIDVSLREFRDLDDLVGIATSLIFVMFWELSYGDVERALGVSSDLESVCDMTGSPHLIAHGLELPAVALMQFHEYETARTRLRKALGLYRQIGNDQCAAHCLENTAGWALGSGQPESSVVLMGATDAFRIDIGVPCPPYERLLSEDILKNAEAAIGRATFESAWQRGQAMGIAEALQTAILATGGDPTEDGR